MQMWTQIYIYSAKQRHVASLSRCNAAQIPNFALSTEISKFHQILKLSNDTESIMDHEKYINLKCN